MERLTSALNILQRSKKNYESAPLDKKNVSWEKEKSAFVSVKEVLVQKGAQKDPRFSEHFSRVVDLLFYFINHRNPDVRLIAEQSLASIFRHMVAESNSSRVVVFLLMELKRNGGARSLIVAFNLLAEVIDFVKPNKTGVIGAHIVGALCVIARRPEDSIQNCLEKILPKIFSVFGRQFTAHRSDDSSSLYEIALENLELPGSTSRASSMLIYQLSLYFPDILDKSFKQLGNYLFRKERKNLVVGALNTLRLLWSSVIFRKDNFSFLQFRKIVYDTLLCLFSRHNEVVVAALEFLETILSISLLFVESLPFSPANGYVDVATTQDIDSSMRKLSVKEGSIERNTSENDHLCYSLAHGTISPLESSEQKTHSFDNPDDSSCGIEGNKAFLSSDEDDILDPLRHSSLSLDQDENSDTLLSSETVAEQLDFLNISRLPTDICFDSFALYTAVLITRRFLLSDQCLRQIPDIDVRVSHKILAMNCLTHLVNCLPNFFNISLLQPEKLDTPLLKDIQLFISHEDDLLKAATITTIINASKAALWHSETDFSDTAILVKKCICEVIRIRRAHCSRSLFFSAKSANDVITKLHLTDELSKFACESASDNFFLLRISVAEYLASIQWEKSDSTFHSLPDIILETYIKLLADGEPKVSKAAARSLPLLVANANYAEYVISEEIILPKSFLCSSFEFNALTVAMGSEYDFFGQPNNTCSINLSIILYKMFARIEVGADELMQAGIISALASLVVDYPPSVYSISWGIVGYNDQSRIGLLSSLLSQCCIVPLSLTTLSNIFQIISFLFAGLCQEQIVRIALKDDSGSKLALAKFFDSKLMEHLLLSSLRVLNLYYTIITEHEHDIMVQKSALLSPNISPVRKVLRPVPSAAAAEQRIQSITYLVGSGIKPTKMTSFLHSPALSNIADSLRGMYSNYMEGLSPDIRNKFSELLISALNNLSCVLEMVSFTYISALLKEVLLYCRVMMDLAPAETVKLVIQLLKVLFGTNGCNLNFKEVKKMIPLKKPCLGDCVESVMLQHINKYTEFVVDSGRRELYCNNLLLCAGWIRRDIISKSQLTPEETVEVTIGCFENFVSKAIRLFYVSNSYSFQALTLHLLCELIAGGIKFSMLDPKMQLTNFLCTYVNEFGSRNWFNSKTINTQEVALIRSVFHFFALMSKMELDSKTMLEPKRTAAFCEVMIKAAIAKPQLACCALNSLQVALVEMIAVRKRFEQSIEKVLYIAQPLGKICPTEYIELWSLYLHSVGCYGDEQCRSKISLLFFDVFQNLKEGWNFDTAFSGMIALRLCSPATFRPIDTFLKNLVQILKSNDHGSFERLLYCSPYLFILFCVMDDNCILPRFEIVADMNFGEFSKLLSELLMECISDLKNLSLPVALCHGAEYCRMLIWSFQTLSYAIRSGGLKSITSTLEINKDHIAIFTEVFDRYPQLIVPFFTFYCSLQQSDFHLFCHGIVKNLKGNCTDTVEELQHLLNCYSPEECKVLTSTLRSSHFFDKLSMEERTTFSKYCVNLLAESASVTFAFDVLNLLTSDESRECAKLESFNKLRTQSFALDYFFYKNDVEKHLKPEDIICEHSITDSTKSIEVVNNLHSFLATLEPKTFDRDALCSLIVSLVKEPGRIISAQCVSGNFSLFDANCSQEVLRCAYNCGRFDIISACMEEINLISTAAFNCGEMYSEYSVISVQKAEAICKICVDLAFEPVLDSSLQLCAQSKFFKDSYNSFLKPAAEWASEQIRFEWWFDKYIEAISVKEEELPFMDPTIFNAITFSISQPSFINAIENSELQIMIEKQLLLGKCLAKILKIYMGSHRMKSRSNVSGRERLNWDIITRDRSGKKDIDLDFFSVSIQSAFELVMTIQETFRRRSFNGYLMESLEKLAKAVTRLPLFNDVACIPRMALLDFSCKWRVELEVRNNAVAVSTVNIHHLCNVDVLRDFIWRLCWAGWNRNINFNNFSMSLFGVLSSTPTGSELTSASLNITEQLMASTAAIEGLTNILLQTTLFPERGNPIFGKFLARPREMSTDFISTPCGQRLCMLKVRLSDASEVNGTFQKNIEMTGKTDRYNPGQLSVHAMWNMSGVLDLERNLFSTDALPSPKKNISNSDSIYLLQSGHDSTNESCLRMLFDIYSHWFRMGVDAVPLPLLSAVIRSMLLLSDLFVELDQFEFVFTHVKSLFNIRSHVESADLGNIICCLLKCIAVLGLEGVSLLKTDAQKLILNCVECGLNASCADLRIRTLQGLLYILQSLSHEDLRAVLPFVQSFLLNELSVRSPGMDPINMDIEFESCEYETYLWSTAFFLCENLLYSSDDFKATLLDFLQKTFISPLSQNWLMDLLTCGAERLVVSSRTYITPFNRMAIQAMKNYFITPKKFVFALRISMACLYHGMYEARMRRIGLEPYDSELYLMEQFPAIFKMLIGLSIMHLAEGNERDAVLLMKVLPYLLIDSLNQSEIINNVLKELIHRYPKQCHPRPKAIFLIVHHWFGVLRSRETEAVVIEWTLNGLESFRYISNAALYRFYVNAFICSSSANPYVASLFHVVVNRSVDASWLDDLWFPFIIRSLLLRLNESTAKELKKKMETFILHGVEHTDPSRVRYFPVL